MPNISKLQKIASRPDGAGNVLPGRPDTTIPPQEFAPRREQSADHIADVILGKPTVAANSGAVITTTLLRSFESAGHGDAEWIRLPAPRTRCRVSALSRTGLNELRESKAIRAITVRKPGAQRGVVLINRQSLLDYLRGLEVVQCGEAVAKGEK